MAYRKKKGTAIQVSDLEEPAAERTVAKEKRHRTNPFNKKTVNERIFLATTCPQLLKKNMHAVLSDAPVIVVADEKRKFWCGSRG